VKKNCENWSIFGEDLEKVHIIAYFFAHRVVFDCEQTKGAHRAT